MIPTNKLSNLLFMRALMVEQLYVAGLECNVLVVDHYKPDNTYISYRCTFQGFYREEDIMLIGDNRAFNFNKRHSHLYFDNRWCTWAAVRILS